MVFKDGRVNYVLEGFAPQRCRRYRSIIMTLSQDPLYFLIRKFSLRHKDARVHRYTNKFPSCINFNSCLWNGPWIQRSNELEQILPSSSVLVILRFQDISSRLLLGTLRWYLPKISYQNRVSYRDLVNFNEIPGGCASFRSSFCATWPFTHHAQWIVR